MNTKKLHQLFLKYNSVNTDTRTIKKNDLYFALKGEYFNGNKFASTALTKGAKFAIIDEEKYAINTNYIVVDNVLTTLQELAKFHRNHLNLKIIALTGSNGKTTTKELINCVLQKKYKTVATKGNLNNHIGVSLTLLSMDENTEIGIVEMGANHIKEIEFLCSIANPDYGYITNFGKAHLEGFKTIEGVIKGKCELFEYLKTHNKPIFFNADDTIQKEKLSTYIPKFGFSKNDSKYYTIEYLEANPFVKLKTENTVVNSNLIGSYNFTNICAAVIIGKYFNVKLSDIKKGIEGYTPDNNRSQIIKKRTNTIILDAYNANPTSMKAALDSFATLKGEHKIAILGDMFELGKEANKEHQAIADYISKSPFEKTYLVGNHFYKTTINSNKIKTYNTFEDLQKAIKNQDITNCAILIKGSRGMALERVLEVL